MVQHRVGAVVFTQPEEHRDVDGTRGC